jgi:hypothetical protein
MLGMTVIAAVVLVGKYNLPKRRIVVILLKDNTRVRDLMK